MAAPGKCPQCGDRLPADVPHGVCPKCMLGLGFDEPALDSSHNQQSTQEPASRFVPPTPSALAIHFPQLEILELIGQGGMGAVYRARQKALDRVVALKVLPPEVGRDPAFAERFSREARALARLTHPNIVMIFDFGQSDGFFYFIMEYVDGVNLRQSLRAGRLTPQQSLAIVPQICEALQFAHEEGIVHRDIKPENVLLDKRGNVKIADFGLAKLLGHPDGKLTLTGTGQVMGTPHYMAPEQLEKPLEVDHRADIYSLGVVFYELLTGELPLGRFAPPSEKSNVSADLDQVVLRTLEKEPSQRYQHASEVKTAVQIIGSSPPTAPPTTEPLVARIPDEARRLRVPFTIAEVYAGFAKATGSMRFNGSEIILEFEVKDDVVGYVRSGVKSVTIPLAEIISFQLVSSWFGLTHNIEIMTDQLRTLKDVPRSEQGRARLQVTKRDAPLARRLVNIVQRATGEELSDATVQEAHHRPPVARPVGNVAETTQAVRGPSTGLLVIGILDCFTPLLALLVLMIAWTQTGVMTTSPEQSRPGVYGQTWSGTDPSGRMTVVRVPEVRVENSRVTSTVSWMPLILLAVASTLQLTVAILIILGALRMKRLDSHGMGVLASIAALLPIHPWFLLGLPIGIWSLLVLARRETKAAFVAQQQIGSTAPDAPPQLAGKPLPPAKQMPVSVEHAASTIRPPGIALIILGGLNVAGTVMAIAAMLLAVGGLPVWVLAIAILPLLVGLFQLKGGIHMVQCRSHTMSMVGALAAILPLSAIWFVTLPFGVWALITLQRGETRQLFEDAPTRFGHDRPEHEGPRAWAILFGFLLVSCLAAALIFYWRLAAVAPPSPERLKRIERLDPMETQVERSESNSLPRKRPERAAEQPVQIPQNTTGALEAP